MTAGILPGPGTKLGPCLKGACKHRDCAMTHEDAERICHHCRKPIGFDTRFYQDGPAVLVHAVCEEVAIEREQRASARSAGHA